MTELLNKAMTEIAKLPAREQDALASWILEELKSDNRWNQAFEETQDELGRLADEALREHRAGKTKPLDPDRI